MKKMSLLLAGFLALLPIAVRNGTLSLHAQAALSGAEKDAKILVAYFSRADENYGVGVVEKGNTQVLAEFIAEYLRADSFHIKVATPYPKNYKKCTEIALAEQKKKARPALAEQMSNLKKYDIVFLGYPIWWGDLPMTVYTFLENGDFSGKIIIRAEGLIPRRLRRNKGY